VSWRLDSLPQEADHWGNREFNTNIYDADVVGRVERLARSKRLTLQSNTYGERKPFARIPLDSIAEAAAPVLAACRSG